jgi:hypothetical protein
MADTKHVGRLKGSKAKVVVVYRTLPGDSKSALVIETAKLNAQDHDSLMKAVESNEGQTAFELYEVLNRTRSSSGDVMLPKFHKFANLQSVPTSEVEMTPNPTTSVALDELNKIIANQKGVSINELSVKEGVTSNVATPTANVMTDDQIASKMRSDADRLYKEAARLRKEAETLSPKKSKTETAE